MNCNSKFSQAVQKVFAVAEQLAKDYGSSYIGSEHLVFAMLMCPESTACKIFYWSKVYQDKYKEYFVRSIDTRANIKGYTPRTKNMIDGAVELGGGVTRTEHLLTAIMSSNDCLAMRIFRAMGIDLPLLAYYLEIAVNLGVEN